MLLINTKLKQARQKLGWTQKQVSDWMLWTTHVSVSEYESGKRKGIPPEYLEFLIHHGFDLNSLFDNTKTEIEFIDKSKNTPPEKQDNNTLPGCVHCVEKDIEISKLKIQVDILQDTLNQRGEGEQTKRRRSA